MFTHARVSRLAGLGLSLSLAAVASAQQSIDGIADYQYNAPIVTQNVQTSFGDNLSELDVAWSYIKDNKLHLVLAGNIENNGNKLNIFIDSVSGGQNRLRGDNLNGGSSWYLTRLGDSGGPNGFIFEAGFDADYYFGVNRSGGGLFVDYSNLPTSSGGSGSYLGSSDLITGTLSGGSNPNAVKANYNASNTAGVTGGSATGYALGGIVSTGLELEIPLAAIGNPTGTVRILAVQGNNDNSSLSNQFLPGVGYNGGTIGSYGEPRGQNLGGTTGSNVGTHFFVAPWSGNGRLAITRVGTGASALTNASTAVFIDEYTKTGVLNNTYTFPVSGTGRTTMSGTATSEGQLSTAADGLSLGVGGYDADTGVAGIAGTATSSFLRRAAFVGPAKSIVASANFSGFSLGNARAAARFDGTLGYAVGSNDGARYTELGTGTTTIVSNTITNIRGLALANNQIWFSTGSGSSRGVHSIAGGLPTGTGNTATVQANLGGTGSPYGFWFSDALTVYIADDTTGAGVRKWTYSGGSWAVSYNLNTSLGSGDLPMAIWGERNSSNQVVLYIVTRTSSTTTKLYTVTDTGGASPFTQLATAPTNTAFRGIQGGIFTVAPNSAPVLDAIGSQSVNELATLTVDANATDADSGQTLTYSLSGAPSGMTINASTGVITWTPTESQGPGSFTFDVVVTDNGSPILSDSETVTVTVAEVNEAPVLNAIGAQSGDEGTLISFTASASDADLPANTLTFSLVGAPAGASINPSSGAFTWTPTEAQSGSHTFDVVVSDAALTDTETITVTVNEVNEAPVLDPIGNQSGDELASITFDANATDADLPAQSLTFSLVGAPAGATIDANTGVFTWTPTEAQDGAHTFTVKVTDDGSPALSDEESITVSVAEVNVAPVLDPIGSQSGDEETPIVFTATASDSDLPANTLTFSLVGAPAGASINSTSGAFTWTPTEAQSGSHTFDVEVSDGALTDTETITVTVNEVNVAPVLDPIGNQSGDEMTNITFDANATDSDVPANTLTFSLSGAPAGASIDGGTGVFTWNPTEAQGPGSYTFDVAVSDGSLSDSETITITVNEVNVAPTANAQSVSTAANTPVAITLTGSDTDVPAQSLSYTVVGSPSSGTLSGTAPSVTYQPNLNFSGTDSFTFKVNDGVVDSVLATVTITVNAPGALTVQVYGSPAPNAFGSSNWPDYRSNALNSLENGLGDIGDRTLDPDAYQQVTQIPWRDIVVSGFVSWRGVAGTGVPFDQEYGNRLHFGVRVLGNGNLFSLSMLQYDVASTEGNNDLGFTGSFDGTDIYSASRKGINYGPDRVKGGGDDIVYNNGESATLLVDELIYVGVGNAYDATFEAGVTDQDKLDATRCYIEPLTPFNVTGTYSIVDNLNQTLGTGTTVVTVIPTNTLPVAQDNTVNTNEDTPVGVTLVATDVDNEPLTYSVVAGPSSGSLSGTAPNLTYTPGPNFNGTDSFTFKATDCVGDSNIATITINVAPVNDDPELGSVGNQSVDELTPLGLTLSSSDADGDTVTYSMSGAPAGATLVGNAFNWTPTEAQGPGSYSVTFTANDGNGGTDSETITITVNEVNVAPTANGQSVSVDENDSVAITLTGSDTDIPTQTLSYTVVGNPTSGVLSGTAPNLTYTPNPNYTGSDSFTFKVNDGVTDSTIATVNITVNDTNDPPVADDASYSTPEDTPINVTLTANDPDSDPLTYSVVTGPNFGALSGTPPNLTYSPNANFNGTDTFTFKANDGTEDSNIATITINVTEVNDAVVEQFASPAPNFFGSPSYDGWETNAMNALENGLSSVGNRATDPTAYVQLGAIAPWGEGTVTGWPTWIGMLNPVAPFDNELGNRLHFGVRVLGNGTRFKLKNLYNDMNSSDSGNTFDFDGDFVGYPYRPWRKGIDYGPDRVKGTSDDVVYNNGESENLEVDELIYSGVGNGFDATAEAGATNQDKLNAVRCYIGDNAPFVVSNVYEIRDDLANVLASSSVSVELDSMNEDPTADSQTVNTTEDVAVNITLTANDPDSDPLTWTIVSGPAHGTLSGTAPNLTYTPNLNFSGADSFTFKVSDGICDSNIATVTINVADVNDMIVEVHGSPAPNGFGSPSWPGYRSNVLNSLENGLGNIGNRTTDPTAYEQVTQIPWRDIVVSGFTSWRGQAGPAAPFDNEYGNRLHFGTRILGNGTRFKLANLAFSMDSDDQDDALDWTDSFTSGDVYSASRKGIDYGPDRVKGGGDDLVYQNGEPATLEVDEFIYVGIGNAFDATFEPGMTDQEKLESIRCYIEQNAPINVLTSYTMRDDLMNTLVSGNANVVIIPTNVLPVADSQTVTTNEDTAVNITLTASDADGEPLTYSVVAGPSSGSLSGTAPNLTYTPGPNFNGTDSFTFKATDCVGDSNIATVTINVTPVNDDPVLGNVGDRNINELTNLLIALTSNDVDGDTVTYAMSGAPAGATLTGNAFNWTPSENQGPGTYNVTFTVDDGNGGVDSETISISVKEVNVDPILDPIGNQTVAENANLTFTVTVNDSDLPANTLVLSASGLPSGATFNPGTGQFNWTPGESDGGQTYTVIFTVDDGNGGTDSETITITVDEVNEAPVITVGNAHSVNEGSLLQFTATATDADVPAQTLTFSLIGEPSGMTINPTTGQVSWTPTEAQGPNAYSFQVRVTDDGTPNQYDEETVTVNVAEVNQAPVANGQSVTTDEDTPANITLVATDGDLPANTLTYTIVTPPTNGMLSGTAPNLVYTPNADYFGTDSFTYKVNDGTVDSNTATVNITINSINDAPVVSVPGPLETVECVPLTITGITVADVDIFGGVVTVDISKLHGKLTLASTSGLSFFVGDGTNDPQMVFQGTLSAVNAALASLTYVSDAGYTGLDTFEIQVSDNGYTGAGGPQQAVAQVQVNVLPATAETINVSSYTITAGEEFTGDLNALQTSDDVKFAFFNDPFTLVAEVVLDGQASVNTGCELRFDVELSVDRLGLSQQIYFYNWSNAQWDQKQGVTASATDSASQIVTTMTGDYLSPTGQVRAKIRWEPINDEDPSQDGWLHNADVAKWTLIR